MIASLRDVVRKQADELQTAKAEVTSLQKQQQVNAAKHTIADSLQKQLDASQSEREAEVSGFVWPSQDSRNVQKESMQQQIADLSQKLSELKERKDEQEKEHEDLLVYLEEVSEKRRRDKAAMRTAGLDVSEDEGGDGGEE